MVPEISQLIHAEKRITELEAEIARLRTVILATDVDESEARRCERLLERWLGDAEQGD